MTNQPTGSTPASSESTPAPSNRRGDRLTPRDWAGALKDAQSLWSRKRAFQLAGALAFYTLFSAAPLLIIVVTITGVAFGEEAVSGEISSQIEQFVGPDAAELLESAVMRARIDEAGILPTLIGIGALLFGATTVFAQLQSALNHIWGVVARPSRSGIVIFVLTRLLSFGMVLMIGLLLFVSFLASMALAAVTRFAADWIPIPSLAASLLDITLSLALATLLFGFIFKVLPAIELPWPHAWRGAAVTAVFFVTGQFLISMYLTRTGTASLYGAAGSVVALLMWVYYSSLILFFGAAFTRELMRRRGERVTPRSGAVKLRTEIVEEA